MSTAKIRIDTNAAEQFLEQRFADTIAKVQKIKGGELAEVFFFEVGSAAYVLRIHSGSNGFIKDRYAFERFRSPDIPIPRIIKVGRFDKGHFYAISEKAPGATQDKLSLAERTTAIPSTLRTLDAIHGVDVSDTDGYGYWQGSGQARRKTLDAHLESSMEGEKYLFSVPYINQEFHRSLWKRTRSLLKYLPRQRYLVHGDYGYDNLVLQGGKISAVLDWGNSAYGDYIHDVAWLDFWDSEIDYGCFMREYYDHTGKKVLHYDERLRLHKLAIASESLGFYAYSGQADTYRKHLEQIKSSDLMA